MHLGFSLTDFTEEDLSVIDLDHSGSIDVKELKTFFEVGEESRTLQLAPMETPEDDLIHQAMHVAGKLTIKVGVEVVAVVVFYHAYLERRGIVIVGIAFCDC